MDVFEEYDDSGEVGIGTFGLVSNQRRSKMIL